MADSTWTRIFSFSSWTTLSMILRARMRVFGLSRSLWGQQGLDQLQVGLDFLQQLRLFEQLGDAAALHEFALEDFLGLVREKLSHQIHPFGNREPGTFLAAPLAGLTRSCMCIQTSAKSLPCRPFLQPPMASTSGSADRRASSFGSIL